MLFLRRSNPTDLELIEALTSTIAANERDAVLRTLIELFVEKQLIELNTSPDDVTEAVSDEIADRLRACHSNAFVYELFSMAAENDPEFDSWIFPDGRAEVVLVADCKIRQSAEGVLERYLDYI